ncbi:MAG: alpha/beta fold hydrolase [Candidatus Binatia bacterium]
MTPHSRFLSVRGANLHYLEWGTAENPPLMLIHGGSAHAHWWDHIAVELAQAYRVIALDSRGHGDSDRANPTSYEINDYVEDIAAVIVQLQLAPCVLIGHSLGGLIAMTYAIRHGQTLSSLVIVDMGPRLQQSRRMQLLSRVPTPIFANEEDLARRFRLLPEETWAAPELLHHIARHSAHALSDGRLMLKTDRATFVRQPHDVSAELSRITCPILLIRGGESKTLSLEVAQAMAAQCPRLRTIEIPGAGHHVFLDKPAAFLEVVRKFLHEQLEGTACKT